MADGNQITLDDIGLNELNANEEAILDLRVAREEAERRTIITALGRSDGNGLRAAEMLGVSRPTLYDPGVTSGRPKLFNPLLIE